MPTTISISSISTPSILSYSSLDEIQSVGLVSILAICETIGPFSFSLVLLVVLLPYSLRRATAHEPVSPSKFMGIFDPTHCKNLFILGGELHVRRR
jgi:hypothetical protein